MRLLFLAWVLALAVGAAPHAAAQGYRPPGSLSVSDPSPDAGSTITVTVVHCAPAGTSVEVSIDGVVVATAVADVDGGFVVDGTVPAEAAGEVVVEAACPDGALASIIDVQIPDLPFDPGDDGDDDGAGEGPGGGALADTGASGVDGTLRLAALAIGLGVAFVVVAASERRTVTGPRPSAQPAGAPAHGRVGTDRRAGRPARTASSASPRPAHSAERAR